MYNTFVPRTVHSTFLAVGVAFACTPSAALAAPIALTAPEPEIAPGYGWGTPPVIDHDSAGNATALWATSNNRLMTAFRRHGSTTFQPSTVVYEPAAPGTKGLGYAPYGFPKLAVDDAGNATAAWRTSTGGIMLATREPGETTFGAPFELLPKASGALNVHLASGNDGATVVVWHTDDLGGRVRAAIRPTPNGAFGAPFDVSAGPTYANYTFSSAIDGSVAVGLRRSTAIGETSELTQVLRRLPGQGSFEAPLEVDAGPATNPPGDIPKVAIARGGAVTAVRVAGNGESTLLSADPGHGFDRSCPTTDVTQLIADSGGNISGLRLKGLIEPERGQVIVTTKTAGGSCFTEESILESTPGTNLGGLSAANDGAGGLHLAWREQSPSGTAIQYAHRTAMRNGVSTLTGTRVASTPFYGTTAVSADRFGNATIASNLSIDLDLALIDHTAPVVSNVSVPTEVVNRDAAQFSIDARDDYSPVTVEWSFGDGTTASGTKVSHAYANTVGGPLTVTATIADGSGNKVVEKRTVARRLTALPAPTVKLSRSAFLADRRGAAIDASALSTKKKVGSLLKLTAEEAGTARFTLERKINGRKSGGKCKKSAKRGKRCTVYVATGKAFEIPVKAGANALRINGRWDGKALKAGNYRLSVKLRSERPESTTATTAAFKITASK